MVLTIRCCTLFRVNCPDCASGPKGIDGHQHLKADDRPNRGGLFVCTVCGAAYSREYQGSGVFVWLKLPDESAPKE
jgi:hypothetical protein